MGVEIVFNWFLRLTELLLGFYLFLLIDYPKISFRFAVTEGLTERDLRAWFGTGSVFGLRFVGGGFED